MGMVVVALFAANAAGRRCDHDQINLKTNQVRRKLRQALILLLGKPVLDGDILSLDPSKLAHTPAGTRPLAPRYRQRCLDPGNLCGRFSRLLRVNRTTIARSRVVIDEEMKAFLHGFSHWPAQVYQLAYKTRSLTAFGMTAISVVVPRPGRGISTRIVASSKQFVLCHCPSPYNAAQLSQRIFFWLSFETFFISRNSSTASGKSESPWG